jgi:hypothetical protein
MAGGGIKAGFEFGKTDDFAYNIAENPVHIRDLNATILHCLGIDYLQIPRTRRAGDGSGGSARRGADSGLIGFATVHHLRLSASRDSVIILSRGVRPGQTRAPVAESVVCTFAVCISSWDGVRSWWDK